MRPARVFRTSVVRLTLFYAAVFIGSTCVIFGFVFWLTTRYALHQTDLDVSGEIAEVQADATAQGLAAAVADYARRSPNTFYRLQDAQGRVVAGNPGPPLAPISGTRELQPGGPGRHGHPAPIRGQGLVMADGSYLFVGLSLAELGELREALGRGLLAGISLTAAIALGGGFLTASRMLGRISSISAASRAIMAGDLSRRIALRGSSDEFDQLSGHLNAMLDRIGELMTGLQQVCNDIAHDLRTPLTRLRQRLELARRGARTAEELAHAIDDAITQSEAILRSFSALLQIAQIEAGSRRAGFKPVALHEVMTDVAELYRPDIEAKGQTLLVDCAAAPAVFGDADLLFQLVANLVVNALLHCPPGARITLRTAAQGGACVASVADDGPGVPASQRTQVLKRFARLDASRTTPGSGLGLTIANAIAALHGAELALADNYPGLRCEVDFAVVRQRGGTLASAS